MKKVIFSSILLFYCVIVWGQSTSNNNVYLPSKFIGFDGSNGANPLFFRTNALNRMKLNGSVSYAVNGYNATRNGYLLLGFENNSMMSGEENIYTQKGAFSLLHLNGIGTRYQEYGYRPWMQTGITFTANKDLSYMGLRKLSTNAQEEDITETVILWSDNSGITEGPDKLVFRFSGYGGTNGNSVSSDRLSNTDLDGLHVAQFSGTGTMGLGNTFGTNATGMAAASYINPQSLLHMSYDWRSGIPNQAYGFGQITYRRDGSAMPGTGETANDGLRWGIDNTSFSQGGTEHLNAYIRWQENTPLIVQTDWDNSAGGTNNGERVRFTSVGSLVTTQGSGYGGLTAPANTTRVAISHNGAQPVTRPLSLLHLGYNNTNGWRPWMDVGIYTSNGTDQVYLGLKPESGSGTLGDRQDAVLNWGDNQAGAGSPDNFRFIFTAAPGGTSPAISADGLEGMRMTPTADTGIYTGIGGDPSANQYGPSGNSINPTATLEVNSWGQTTDPGGSSGLRFTNLNSTSPTIVNPAKGVLSVDEEGDVIYVPYPNGLDCWDLNGNGINDPEEDVNSDGLWNALDCQGAVGPAGPAGITIGAHNGTAMSLLDPEKVAFGQNLNEAGAPGRLLNTREVPMNDYNIVFTNVANTSNGAANRIGIGTSTPTAKLDITMEQAVPSPVPTALNIVNNQVASNGQAFGQRMTVTGNNATNTGGTIFVSPGSSTSQGLQVQISGASTANSTHLGLSAGSYVSGLPVVNQAVAGGAGNARRNIGGGFTAQGVLGSTSNRGVIAEATGVGTSENVGLLAQVSGAGTTNYGVWSQVLANTGLSIGVLASVNNSAAPANRAGYFIGKIETTSAGLITSDQQFKTNISPLSGSLRLLQEIKPVSYYMDSTGFTQFNFDSREQFGFVAQELEAVFPNLVHESIFPAQYDSLGNETAAELSYKSVNYTALIPVNTQAIIELNQKVERATLSDEAIKINVQDLHGSLAKVLAMRGVSYSWDHSIHPELNLDSASHIGFIAQEIQQIDSRLTYLADDSLLHVEYDKVVPVLAEAIQELNEEVKSRDSVIHAQQITIEGLNDRLSQLENCLSGILPLLCQLNQKSIEQNGVEVQEQLQNIIEVELNNGTAIVLNQNVPNPFAESTVITFSIPESVADAQIIFHDAAGTLIKTVDIRERGNGQINVYANDLSSGIYTYSLVADGKIAATRRMMKQ